MALTAALVDEFRTAGLGAYSLGSRHKLPIMRETTSTPESRGQLAYTAYCRSVNFKAVNGEELPMFFDLDEERRRAWMAAADVIWQIATTGVATL